MKRVTENAMLNCTLGFRVYCDCYKAKKNLPLKFSDTCMSFFIPLKCGSS